MTRETIIKEVLDGSHDVRYSLAQIATGVGKTKLALEYINLHLNTGKVLWLVPMTSLISGVYEELKKWQYDHLESYITVICYASMNEYLAEGSIWDVVILDEVHNSVSPKRLNALSRKNYFKCLALSATISQEVSDVLDLLGTWHKTKVSLEDAIDAEILAEPRVVIKYLDLDDTKIIYPYKYKTGSKMMTARGYYDALSASITYWKDRYEQEAEFFAGNKMKQLGSERIRFLSQVKEPFVKELLDDLGSERYICFTGSVEQAKRLGGKNVCSADTTKKSNLKLIEDFNEGKVSNLFAKAMLQEGQNLKNTKVGVIIQLGNQERFLVQALGRCLRSSEPIIYVFIINNTVDNRFFEKSFQSNKNLLNNNL